MTPRQKELVQISFEQLRSVPHTTAALFFGRLVDLDPDVLRLFPGEAEEQGRVLINVMGLAMKGLNRFEELMGVLRDLGARHAGYGVRESDYETVGAALIWTLEQSLGQAFTQEIRAAWIAVYQLFAGTLRAGAREALVVTAVGSSASTPRAKWHECSVLITAAICVAIRPRRELRT